MLEIRKKEEKIYGKCTKGKKEQGAAEERADYFFLMVNVGKSVRQNKKKKKTE
jgi:hypothetical protein